MLRLSPLFPLVVVSALLAALSAPARADTIVKTDGSRIDGVQITAETYEKVSYRKSGVSSAQSIDASSVREIVYSRTSRDYRAAIEARDEGKLVESVNLFLTAADDEGYGEFQQAMCMVEAAEAMLNLASYTDAQDTFQQLLADFPKTRHLARALLGQGRAALAARDLPAAAAAFERLKTEAAEKKLGERWPLEAEYYGLITQEIKAGGKLDDRKRDEMIRAYESLRGKTAGTQTAISNQCALRIGRLKLEGDDVAAARRMFQEVIDGRLESGRDVVAGAYNGRGRCGFREAQQARADGESPGDIEALYQEALFDFLRVVVHYTDVQAEQPEALYWAGQCFRNLPSTSQWEVRAKQLEARLKTDFPESSWGKRSTEER